MSTLDVLRWFTEPDYAGVGRQMFPCEDSKHSDSPPPEYWYKLVLLSTLSAGVISVETNPQR